MFSNNMNIKSSKELVDNAKKAIKSLSAIEIKNLKEKGEITLIDIRDIRELWREGTIEDSIHIPRGMLEFWLDPESNYYKEKKIGNIKNIALFCALGLRSALATKTLQDMGFKNVSNVEGGYDSLKESGMKIVEKKKEINYFKSSFKANSSLSCPQKILLFTKKVGAPKTPLSNARVVLSFSLSFITVVVDLR